MAKTWKPQVYWRFQEGFDEIISIDNRDHSYAEKICTGDIIRIEGRFLQVADIRRDAPLRGWPHANRGNQYLFIVRLGNPDQTLLRFINLEE